MDTSGYDPETGRTFTRAEPHEITHEGCVWTDEQIRELVPHGVTRGEVVTYTDEWLPVHGDWIGLTSPDARHDVPYLTSSQVAERVLRCEECAARTAFLSDPDVDASRAAYRSAAEVDGDRSLCLECGPLRTLLLKLAGEGER